MKRGCALHDATYVRRMLVNLSIPSASLQVYDSMEPVLESLQGRAHGGRYVNEDDTAEHALGFAQVSLRMYVRDRTQPGWLWRLISIT